MYKNSIFLILLLSLLLSACTAPVVTSTPTDVVTVTPLPNLTPTVTSTRTPIPLPTATPVPAFTIRNDGVVLRWDAASNGYIPVMVDGKGLKANQIVQAGDGKVFLSFQGMPLAVADQKGKITLADYPFVKTGKDDS
jgi:hypothetical protein